MRSPQSAASRGESQRDRDALRQRRDDLEAEVRALDAEIALLDCPGEGRCHGCASWCDRCGDVGTVCGAVTCDRHQCHECRRKVEAEDEIEDGVGWCTACREAFAWHEFLDGWRRLGRAAAGGW